MDGEIYKAWFSEILNLLEEPSVVDNASYHSIQLVKLPSRNSRMVDKENDFIFQQQKKDKLQRPSIDFSLRRSKLASDDLYKEACRIPKEIRPTTKKNISRDAFGSKLGRIHMGKQNIHKLQTRKMKGLRKTPEEKKQMLIQKKLAKKQHKNANPVNV